MEKLKCKLCKKREAEVELSLQKIKVCKECFCDFFERRIKKTIEKYRMFSPKDKVGVCVSGGKDSTTLLVVLKKLCPDLNLTAIHINLGIGYFSDTNQKTVKEICEKYDTPLFLYELKKEEGFSIDEFVFTRFKNKICSVCGVVKRYLFSKIAKKLKINVLATGHHLDDILSVMLNLFFQGDFESITKLRPVLKPILPGQAKKIKPLCTTPEKDIVTYVNLEKLPIEKENCPHQELTPAKKLKGLLEDLQKENKYIKSQLFSVFNKKLIPLFLTHPKYKKREKIEICQKCKEITTSFEKICSFCKRVEILNKIPERKLKIDFKEFLERFKNLKEEFLILDLTKKENEELLKSVKRKIFKKLKKFKHKPIGIFHPNEKEGYFFNLKLRKLGFYSFLLLNYPTEENKNQ